MKNNSVEQFVNLRRQLSDERECLRERLSQINEVLGQPQEVGSSSSAANPSRAKDKRREGKRTMSPEGRARIAAAQRARWAKQRDDKPAAASNDKSSNEGIAKRKMSPAARKAIAEAARKRWAEAKAAGKSRL